MELYQQKISQQEISKRLKVSPATIQKDLIAIRLYWKERFARDYQEKLDEEFANIDRLEWIAFEAWERSCNPQVTSSNNKEYAKERAKDDEEMVPIPKKRGRPPKYKRDEETGKMVLIKETVDSSSKTSAGNPAFLERMAWCVETRLKLIGQLKAEISVTNNTTNILNTIDVEMLYLKADIEDPAEEAIKLLEADKTLSEAPGMTPTSVEPAKDQTIDDILDRLDQEAVSQTLGKVPSDD